MREPRKCACGALAPFVVFVPPLCRPGTVGARAFGTGGAAFDVCARCRGDFDGTACASPFVNPAPCVCTVDGEGECRSCGVTGAACVCETCVPGGDDAEWAHARDVFANGLAEGERVSRVVGDPIRGTGPAPILPSLVRSPEARLNGARDGGR